LMHSSNRSFSHNRDFYPRPRAPDWQSVTSPWTTKPYGFAPGGR
jgi:hypothetical protein